MELKATVLEAYPPGAPEHRQAKRIKKTSFGSDPWTAGVDDPDELFAELDVLHAYLRLSDEETAAKKAIKEATEALYRAVLAKYPALTDDEVRRLVIEDKWFAAIEADVRAEVERVTQRLTGRVQALEERYDDPLPTLLDEVAALSSRVDEHLMTMGVAWN